MNTKKILLRFLLVFTVLASASCAIPKIGGLGGGVSGSGNVQTETRDTGAFQAITVEYPADVIIQQGGQESLQIQADDNLLRQLSTEVSEGRLTVKNREAEWKNRVNPSTMVKITIAVKDLAEIDFGPPVGTLEMNDFQAGTLKLVLSGGGQIKVNGLQVDLLEGVLSGAGDIQVSGTADELNLLHSGMGSLDLSGLPARKAVVELSGAGDVIVHVESELKATVSGAGSVKYFGTPRIETNETGAKSVIPAG